MKIGVKLSLIIGLLVVVAVLLGGLGLSGMHKISGGLDTVYKDRVVPLKDIKRIADLYAVNIVDTSHKIRAGTLSWEEGLQNFSSA